MRHIALLALLLASCEVADVEPEEPAVGLVPLRAGPAPGLDPSFGGDGKAWVGGWNGLEPRGVAVNEELKPLYSSRLVLSGLNLWLVGRAKKDGTHDADFGDSPFPVNVNTYLGVDEALAGEIWYTPGGLIRAVGTVFKNGTYRAVLLCLKNDGTLDKLCGNGKGFVEVSAPDFTHSSFRYLAIDDKFNIVAVGKAWNGSTGSPGAADPIEANNASSGLVVRLNGVTGDLDTSFSGDGKVILNGAGHMGGLKVAIGPDKMEIALVDFGLNQVFKLRENGSFDSSFSGDGKLALDNDYDATDIAASADGLVFVSVRKKAGAEKFSVVGFEANGTSHFARRDIDFVAYDHERATQIEWSADHERLYLLGWAEDEHDTPLADRRVVVAALRPDGVVDVSFHGSGKDTLNFGSPWEEPRGLTIVDEKLVGVVRPFGEDIFGLGLFRYRLAVGELSEPCKAKRKCTPGLGLFCTSVNGSDGFRGCGGIVIPTNPPF